MALETFEEFMQRCLHDPKRGYYARNIRSIGPRGDFTTSPQLSEAPAKAIARWAARAMKDNKTRNLIEIGPGLGTLSRQVLRYLPLLPRLLTRLYLVESSPTLRDQQKKILGARAQIHPDIHSALEACAGEAVIFSNELVDAFPVRLFEKTENRWHEITLEHSEGTTREIPMEPASLPESSIFQRQFPTGQRIEVHESYRQWLESWLPHWKRGEILTIDYGNTAEKIYHRKPKGSLRGYLLHQRIEGNEIYLNQGLQDLTADVNFTDLIEWSEAWLSCEKIGTLADFIKPFCKENESRILSACEHFTCLHQSRRTTDP